MTYQRQCLSCHGTNVHIDHYMHERLSADQYCQSSYRIFREFLITHSCYDRASGKQTDIQDEDKNASYQSVFLHQEAEHIVAINVIYLIFLRTVPDSFA